MSLVLAYDCAVSGLTLAVVRDGEVLAVHREEGREQAARLLPAIAELLDKAGVPKRALSMIATTIGPGSFTGVRVGLAAARGLSVALAIPLAGIATTETLLAQAPESGRLAVAAIDSHLGDWFCATAEAPRSPFLASTAALAERLAGRSSLIIGPQAGALAPLLPGAEADVAWPDASVVARLALKEGIERWRERNRTEGLPRPVYLRGVNVTAPDGTRLTVD
ncbi:MAG TPA: tRNA (adenosine(37)-N6)-threonylcarbamoyltransferase complex dimerization subunit type 1 TsaB [Reyranella sp.]|nr:tRNA (adenosine(37)-N6)-threonylcarbamoyltransferase complex dimerization subunit type 1 TsaB [Reyranella sp.]